jgi:GNAT superfamily N-acetyltransferase
MTDTYAVLHATPSVETYRRLRGAAGMSERSVEAAMRGLAGTLFAVQILKDGETVGMGRVVGDGGCHFQVVDIAVAPADQGRGLGRRIMTEIAAWLERSVPASAFVSLFADGTAHALYAQFGFAPTAPGSIGMGMKR